ncbi:MAG: (Fe-S)-binding protein [Bacilli bacterium]|nr:(Fe-S)-binding protein [Bacilli bacterium]
MDSVAKIFVAIGLLFGVAVVLGVVIAFIVNKFKVKEDERAIKLLGMLPGANCGACGYPGCAGLRDAIIEGKVTKIKSCKVISTEGAQEIVDYLNSAEGEDGSKLKVTL